MQKSHSDSKLEDLESEVIFMSYASIRTSELRPENTLLSRRSLKKLTIQLMKDGEEIDSLVMDTFIEEGNHAN